MNFVDYSCDDDLRPSAKQKDQWKTETCETCGWARFLSANTEGFGGCRKGKLGAFPFVVDRTTTIVNQWPVIQTRTPACPAWIGRK